MKRGGHRKPRAALALGAALLLAGTVPGCGWHAGLLVPEGARSVGVEFFDNTTPERDLEVELAAEMGRALVNLVDLPLVSAERADVVIRGQIDQFGRRSGIRSEENVLLETGVRISARAELVRRTSGERLAEASSAIWSDFAVRRSSSVDPEASQSGEGRINELEARGRALRYVADELVLDLFSPSSYKDLPK